MNTVRLNGKLTKAPWYADKGWASCTIAVPKEGTNFSLWVPLFVPAGLAPQLKTCRSEDSLEVVGELDQRKDKTMQVKVLGLEVKKGANIKSVDNGFITDDDIPF